MDKETIKSKVIKNAENIETIYASPSCGEVVEMVFEEIEKDGLLLCFNNYVDCPLKKTGLCIR